MNLIEALQRCRDESIKVRPACWRTCNAGHWVEARPWPASADKVVFVECGAMEEIPHALRLQFPSEFLGQWEVMPNV